MLSITGVVATVSLVRCWCAMQLLNYYTHITKRTRRKPLSINTRPGERYSDRDGAPDSAGPTSGKRSHGHRIFLLPSPIGPAGRDAQGVDVPLLSLTTSSPIHTSFPPMPSAHGQGGASLGGGMASPAEQKYLVYAPVS